VRSRDFGVRYIIPGVSIQSLLQSLLIQEMTNETDRSAQHKYGIHSAVVDVIRRLFFCERAAMFQQVHEAHGNAAVHVQNQRRFFHGRNFFYFESEI